MVTFVDRKKVKPFVTPKGKEIYGQVFRQAGFIEVGETVSNKLLALQLRPEDMPPPEPAIGYQLDMLA